MNPLLKDWATPFGIAPFAEISDEDFAPALTPRWMRRGRNIRAIADNPAPPTFANTIAALELADERLSQVLGVFYNLAGADSNPRREELQRRFLAEAVGVFVGNYPEPGAVRADRDRCGRSATAWGWMANRRGY